MYIGVDCEFSFDSDNEFFLVCAAVTEESGAKYTWWYDQLDSLKTYIMTHKGDVWVAHNIETAEGYMWQSLGFRPTLFKWNDTLLMSRIARNECSLKHPKHDLASVMSRELRIRIDEEEKHANQKLCVWEQDCTWEAHLAKLEAHKELLLKYCLSDTAYLCQLANVLSAKIKPMHKVPLDKALPMHADRRPGYYGFLAAYASEISWAGIPLNPARVKRLLVNAPKAMADTQMRFSEKYPGAFRLVGKKLTKNVAVCREYAEKVYGDNPPRTASGQVSLASAFTKEHKDIEDFLGDYYNMDKKCRALASFSKPKREKNWLGMYLPKRGVVRPRLNVLGTQTGRCGSKPSTGFIYTMGKSFRGLIDPPEGWVVVELDYHSQEIGCQAFLTGDKTMTEMYGLEDYYTEIAKRMDPTVKDKYDPKRKKYKVISLMSNYGCGFKKLANIAGIPESEAKSILKGLKRMFSTYWKYVEKRIDLCGEGSSMYFSDGFKITNRGGKVTSLGNWPFQGVGALILRKLLVKLWQKNIRVVAPIHDAVAFMAPESCWQQVSALVGQLMRDVSKECLGKEIDVGNPEVTFHGIPNCHSEFSSREQYATEKPNSYMKEFMEYMGGVDSGLIPDDSVESLYVDEEWMENNVNNV